MTDDQVDKIDRYLLGTPAERAALRPAIEADPALAGELQEAETALAAIELAEDRALKERLRRLEHELGNATAPAGGEPKVVPLQPRRRTTRRWLAFAATLLLLLAAALWLMPDRGTTPAGAQLALADFEVYPNIAYTITKGGGEITTEAAAYTAYEAGDYGAAERAFLQLPRDPVTLFYLGQTELAQQKFAAAEARFTALATTPDFNLARESEFYAAAARLGRGDTAGARGALRTIADRQDHPSRREALALLAKL